MLKCDNGFFMVSRWGLGRLPPPPHPRMFENPGIPAADPPTSPETEQDALQSERSAAVCWIPAIMSEMSKKVVGQQHLAERLIIELETCKSFQLAMQSFFDRRIRRTER